jgi:hypothetical protein
VVLGGPAKNEARAMRYKLSATDVHRGGATVAEFDLDRPSRDAALSDGIIGVLSDNRFPPEVLALYRGALDRNFTRDEALDQILADFGVQFFIKTVDEHEQSPQAPTTVHASNGVVPQPTQVQPAPSLVNLQLTSPRQILRDQLKSLISLERSLRDEMQKVTRRHAAAKKTLEDCRALLRKVQPPKNARSPGFVKHRTARVVTADVQH